MIQYGDNRRKQEKWVSSNQIRKATPLNIAIAANEQNEDNKHYYQEDIVDNMVCSNNDFND